MNPSDDLSQIVTGEDLALTEEVARTNDTAKALYDLTEKPIERGLSRAGEIVLTGYRRLEESERRASGEEQD